MNNWQTIETAPKDRRILLAYELEPKIRIGKHQYSNVFTGAESKIVPDCWPVVEGAHYVDEPIAWQELPEFDGEVSER